MTSSDHVVVDLHRWRTESEVANDTSSDELGVDDDGASIRSQIADLQAVDAMAVAIATEYYDPDIDSEIVTALRFATCTGACAAADSYGVAETFAAAADYLVAAPEVAVVATNWQTMPCNCGGEHLILEVTVRSSPPAPTQPYI